MKTTFYLIRHGQTVWNEMKKMQGLKNSDLTESGIKQATLLGEKLANEPIDLICTSPSVRAIRTSELVNQQLKVPVIKDDGFQEIDMGLWEGKTYTEIEHKYPKEWDLFWHDPLNFQAENKGETFADLNKRSANSLDEMIKTLPGKHVAIVSHRITIKMMVSNLLDIPLTELEDVLPNSLTKIVVENGKATLIDYSNISHYQEYSL